MENIKFKTGSYIIDENYVISNYNEVAKKYFPEIKKGVKCYKTLKGYTSPCPNCPIFTGNANAEVSLKRNETEKELFGSFSNIPLENGKQGYIININESMLDQEQYQHQFNFLKHKMDIYRQANYTWAYLYFECNLSKDILISNPCEVIDYVEKPLDMESRGFKTRPINFTEFTEWRLSRGILSRKEEYRAISDSKNLIKCFNEGQLSQSITFRAKSTNGYLIWEQMSYYMYKPDYTDDIYALCVLTDISKKLEMETNTKRNEEIMRILANEYSSVLYFDLNTQVVSIYALPATIETDLKIFLEKSSYDAIWKEYLNRRVKNSDKEHMEQFSNLDFLRETLKDKQSYSYIYRVGDEVDYRYHEIKIVKVGNDNLDAIVIGIADKHDAIVTQQEQQKQLEYALLLAQKDSLTGIRNRTAYDLAAKQIDKDVEEGKLSEYAILMCDVNGLKLANDIYGHDKGNELLINASKLICDVFKHSMVCRIGGDEFVAIIKNEDYANRKALLSQIRKTVRANEESDLPIYKKISIATGLAEFDANIDKQCDDVFHRADTLMYINKAEIKVRMKL